VFYEGCHDFSKLSLVFYSCTSLRIICVSPDYNSSIFCGRNVTSSSDICIQFRSMFNHCYKGSCVDGRLVAQKRRNATEMEGKKGCGRYHCDNVTGLIVSYCNSEEGLICYDDTCMDVLSINYSKYVEILLLKGLNLTTIDASKELELLCSLLEIQCDSINIGYVLDENGFVVRILIFVDDENTAKVISIALNKCSKDPFDPIGSLKYLGVK